MNSKIPITNTNKEIRKFSVGFVFLMMIPMFLMAVFLLVVAVKFEIFTVQKALAAALIILTLIYFTLPRAAGAVFSSIVKKPVSSSGAKR